MHKGETSKPFRIGTWLVQPGLNRISEGDHVVAIEFRLMATLVCLANRPRKIVSADELLDTVWHGRAQGDNSVYQAVTQLRKALGDDAHQPRYIETIPKKGYRLICPVVPMATDGDLPVAGETRIGRRFVFLASSVALVVIAFILTISPELREGLMPSADTARERSVAVLPFVDMSENGNQQYLGDGISEELIHVLSRLPDLQVTARTSSFAFRDQYVDVRQIGKQLNVAMILEGSVRRDGDRIRITAQLVDSRDGYHLWSETFDRHSSDIFNIQDQIVAAIAKTFKYRQRDVLASDRRETEPDKLQAYDHYLLGLSYLHQDAPSNYVIAIERFKRAIEADPSFARAYASLSESYSDWYWYEGTPDLLSKAESAAEYALLLDDRSGDAYRALGYTRHYKRDYSGSAAAFTKAIELNANDVRSYAWLAAAFNNQGAFNKGTLILQQALERNPMSGQLNNRMGLQHLLIRPEDWETAFNFFARAMQRDPGYPYSYLIVGHFYILTGQLDRAIPYVRKALELTSGPTKIGLAAESLMKIYVDIGDYESAAQMIRRLKDLEPDHSSVMNGEIYLLLARGDFAAARDIVHDAVPANFDKDPQMGLMAFYEMVIGDTEHAENIYSRLSAVQEPDTQGEVNLYRENEISWGMLGAVNLAYLHKRNGQSRTADDLLRNAREFIESKNYQLRDLNDFQWHAGAIQYVHAQIAALEEDNEAAMDNFRLAVEAGWIKPWYARIDPIMADLREDVRFMQILKELEDRLLEMRENPKIIAAN